VRFVSTHRGTAPVDLKTALFHGLAPDGGLYLPERIPKLAAELLEDLAAASRQEIAYHVLAPYVEELSSGTLRTLVSEALDFEIPLVPIEPGVFILELFHGPTLAFKDIGARVMARLMAAFHNEDDEELTILVATSGDTGSAVAHAFLGIPRTRVVILYPDGKVSPLQEKQFTTLGKNVMALAVAGTFDDCQRMVKDVFADRKLRVAKRLTSANSINIGRLLPQIVYYFLGLSQLLRSGLAGASDGKKGEPGAVFSVPSGNFGNLCGGLLAKRMGLSCRRFIAATNVNDVVPEYLRTGRFAPRASIATISNAMDVGNPSNFARIQALYHGDRDAFRREVLGSRHDDDETRRAIREVHGRTGTILDPHTAVGFLALKAARAELGDIEGIVLATAHPAKFREEVERVLQKEIALPPALEEALSRESRSRKVGSSSSELKELLLSS
jgi:threonine synthase